MGLGPVTRGLIALYLKWANDFEVMHMLGSVLRPRTWEITESEYERVSTSEHLVTWTVFELESMEPIGLAELFMIDLFNQTAELTVLIGEKDRWGRGFGTECARLALEHAFVTIGIRNVLARIPSDNERALRCFARVGFREIGRQREARRVGSRAYDLVLMECLASEFGQPTASPAPEPTKELFEIVLALREEVARLSRILAPPSEAAPEDDR